VSQVVLSASAVVVQPQVPAIELVGEWNPAVALQSDPCQLPVTLELVWGGDLRF